MPSAKWRAPSGKGGAVKQPATKHQFKSNYAEYGRIESAGLPKNPSAAGGSPLTTDFVNVPRGTNIKKWANVRGSRRAGAGGRHCLRWLKRGSPIHGLLGVDYITLIIGLGGPSM